MQINETKTSLDAQAISGKTTYSPEQIQALCTSNSYLRGWLEAFYNLSNWDDSEQHEDSDSSSTQEGSAIDH